MIEKGFCIIHGPYSPAVSINGKKLSCIEGLDPEDVRVANWVGSPGYGSSDEDVESASSKGVFPKGWSVDEKVPVEWSLDDIVVS